MRRATFYRDGRPHQLLVIADLSRALREEEQPAWQRIVRVLSHEINNSLTPIKSIAHSIKRMISRVPDIPRAAEIQDGLKLIESAPARSAGSCAPTRSSRDCRSRSSEPIPSCRWPAASSSSRTACRSRCRPSPDVDGRRRSRSARAAADQHRPQRRRRVARDRRRRVGRLEAGRTASSGDDRGQGPGLPDTSNLFVPFFTTKPNGSGIGLALSRQIAEAHGGTMALENRADAKAAARFSVCRCSDRGIRAAARSTAPSD